MRASATATTWRRSRPKAVLRARLGDIDLQTLAYGETHRAQRRDASRCTRPATCWARRRCGWSTAARCGSAAATTRWSRTHLRAVRAGALRLLHHRVDLRPADLPLAAARTRCSPTSTAGGRRNARPARASVLFCYSFGKAQRILAGVDPSIGPISCTARSSRSTEAYRAAGVALPATQHGHRRQGQGRPAARAGDLPAQRRGQPVDAALRRLRSTAFASGWMQLRGDAPARRLRPRLRAVRPCRLAGPA